MSGIEENIPVYWIMMIASSWKINLSYFQEKHLL